MGKDVIYDAVLLKLREADDLSGYAEKGETPQLLTVSNINALTSNQCAALKNGDVVVVDAGGIKTSCIVSSITSNELYLCYIKGDNHVLQKAKYAKTNGVWSYEGQKRFYLDTPVATSQPAGGMLPNVVYNLGQLSGAVSFTLFTGVDADVANVWRWNFDTGATIPAITWPQQITSWNGGSAPTIEANKHYEIALQNGFATCFSNASAGGGGGFDPQAWNGQDAEVLLIDRHGNVLKFPSIAYRDIDEAFVIAPPPGKAIFINGRIDSEMIAEISGSRCLIYSDINFLDGTLVLIATDGATKYALKVDLDGTLSTELVQ